MVQTDLPPFFSLAKMSGTSFKTFVRSRGRTLSRSIRMAAKPELYVEKTAINRQFGPWPLVVIGVAWLRSASETLRQTSSITYSFPNMRLLFAQRGGTRSQQERALATRRVMPTIYVIIARSFGLASSACVMSRWAMNGLLHRTGSESTRSAEWKHQSCNPADASSRSACFSVRGNEKYTYSE